MSRTLTRLVTVLVILAPAVAQAQGVLVVVDPNVQVRLPRPPIIWPPHPPHPPWPRPTPPPPPARYKISQLEVNARLIDQVAQVQVQQTFENVGSRQMEVSFVFPLPYDGAIEQMTLLVDGKEYPAKLLDAKEARRLYEAIVRKNKDPALLEWMGTGLFKTSVFPVPAGAKRTVSLRYSQMCRKQGGLTDFLVPLSTAKYTAEAVDEVSFRVSIESADEIKNVYSPTHAVDIKRPDKQHAVVSFTEKKQIPTSDFRLFYDVGDGKVSTRVLSHRAKNDEDGFFLLLASPEIKARDAERTKKTVVFVVDRSGSMSGKKIEQARGALKHVLNNLRDGDLFNIVAYDSQVETFRPELQRYNDKTRKAALGFVESVYAGGSTNIDGALQSALGHLQDSSRPNYVLFLTDGLPTAGETNEMKIVQNAAKENKVRARIFTFGVGYDVNSRLLDKLVHENFGRSEYVRPDEDIEDRVSKLYNRIEAPVMTDVKLTFEFDEAKAEQGEPINRVYPKGSFDLFAGEQLVVVGRYKKSGTAKVVVAGSVAGKNQKFDFPVTLVAKSKDETHGFIEKLWAIRRVGEILTELDLNGKNEELVKELVQLSQLHGILTPYTSFMADDTGRPGDLATNVRRAGERLGALEQSSGASGVLQRALKGDYRRAAGAPGGAAAGKPLMDAFGRDKEALEKAKAEGLHFVDEVDREAQAATRTVRNVANRTFYWRKGQWVDSQITTKQQEANVRKIKQFSDEYFELAARHGKKLSQYMVFDEPVLIELEGRACLIEP